MREEEENKALRAVVKVIVAPFVYAGVVVVTLPVGLLQAWMRSTVWGWFHAALRLPPVGFWAMFAAGLFLQLWKSPPRALDKKLYGESAASWFFGSLALDFAAFAVAWALHLTGWVK